MEPEVLAFLGGLAGAAIPSALSFFGVRHQTKAARRESFGQYQQGRRAVYRELLLLVETTATQSDGKYSDENFKTLRDKYLEAYFGSNEEIEKALESYWPESARQNKEPPVSDERPAVEAAMVKHVRP